MKKPTFEELGIIEMTEQKKVPQLELKPLPEELKYAYIGEEHIYPVVISSTLTSNREGKLLSILKKHKSAIGWTLSD